MRGCGPGGAGLQIEFARQSQLSPAEKLSEVRHATVIIARVRLLLLEFGVPHGVEVRGATLILRGFRRQSNFETGFVCRARKQVNQCSRCR